MDSCAFSAYPTVFFACSGGSNVGQIANEACRQLTADGHGEMSCLAGVCAHVNGIVKFAKASRVVAVDGCGWNCARKTLEAAKVPVCHHFVLTDWGIERKPELLPDKEEIALTKNRILAIVE
ncbi:MAG: putative zinc-binding protein [Sporomusaceae bacterium]|nr:putative zinc-binding protein [Sporomusaceae bacterium]